MAIKNIFKKILNILVDIFCLPFGLLFKFIKNADNVLVSTIRLLLLLFLFSGICYIFIAKPYRVFAKNFYFEKYKTAKEANKASIIESKNINDNVNYFEKVGSKCKKDTDKNGNFYICLYTENKIYKKNEWKVFLRYNNNNIITHKRINKKEVNKLKELYNKIK